MKEFVLFKNEEGFASSKAPAAYRAEEGNSAFFFHEIPEGNARSGLSFFAGEGSVLEAVVFQNAPAGSNALVQIRLKGERDSVTRLTVIQNGAGKSEIDIRSESAGQGARFEMRGVQNAGGEQQFVIRAGAVHPVPHTSSDMQVRCVARDSSRSVFNGTIEIAKGAHHTEAFQKNRNLLLSDRATVDSFPKLLIANDNVKCAHGSSTSSLDPEQANYLRSRGIPREQAEAMLVRGFLREALSGITDPGCRRKVFDALSIDEEEWS